MDYKTQLERLIIHQIQTAIINCNSTKMKQTLVYTYELKKLITEVLKTINYDNTKINLFTPGPIIYVTITYKNEFKLKDTLKINGQK